MTKFTTLSYLQTTAVQLAAFPQAMVALLKERTLPRAPNVDDKVLGGFHTLMGGLAAVGITRLGTGQLNATSLVSAIAVGVAIGASVGIATWIGREGHRAKELANEQNSPSSPNNVAFANMATKGPDPWAINRVLERDPKAFPKIEAAVLAYAVDTTHARADHAQPHAAVALATALRTRAGDVAPAVHVLKEKLMEETSAKLEDSPSAQLLVNTLAKLPTLPLQDHVLDMHASWNTMLNTQMSSPDAETFAAELSTWAENYLPSAQYSVTALSKECFDKVVAMSQDPVKVIAAYAENRQTNAMVASMLLDTQVAPQPSKSTRDPNQPYSAGMSFS